MQDATPIMSLDARSKTLRRWAAALGTGLFAAVALATQLPSSNADPRIAQAIDGVAEVSVRPNLHLLGKFDEQVNVQLTGGNARNVAAVPADAFSMAEAAPEAPDWSDLFGGENKTRDAQKPQARPRQVATTDTSIAPLPDSVVDTRPNPVVPAPVQPVKIEPATAPAAAQQDAFGMNDAPKVATEPMLEQPVAVLTEPVTTPAQPQRTDAFFVSSEGNSTEKPTDTKAWPEEPVVKRAVAVSTPATTTATTTKAATTEPTIIRSSAASTASSSVQPKPAAAKPKPAVMSVVISGLDDNGDIRLMTNRSTAIRTKRSIKTINVAAPDVADVLTLAPDMVLVTAKKPGSTQIMLWDESGNQAAMDVYVTFDLGAIKDIIKTVVPGADIEVAAANGAIVLKGEVPDVATAEKLLALVKPYGTVVNFLQVAGGQQILLEVQFAEVSRSVVRQLGVNLATQDGTSFIGSNIGNSGAFGIKEIGDSDIGLGVPEQVRNATIFGTIRTAQSGISYLITALKDNNLLRVLAKPNLVAMSGQKASFLAGGEIPIPQPSKDGLGITYKEYGIRLNYTPIALGNGNISMQMEVEVSEVDPSVSVQIGGGPVPGFTTRKSSTVAELADGQTMAIAGMLNNSIAANRQAIPLLGELPVIGSLFRSTRYQQRETELLILITPRLVGAMNPDEVPAVPGEQWQNPNDVELYFGDNLGKDVTPRPTRPAPAYRPAPAHSAMPEAPVYVEPVADPKRGPRFEPAKAEDRIEHVPFTPQNPGSKVADPLSEASTDAPAMTELDTGLVAPQ
jgi:pilus assembly protein CpaC